MEKQITKRIIQETKILARKNSKAFEILQNCENNLDDWSISKLNRWIGYSQCLLVAEGAITIDDLRILIKGIENDARNSRNNDFS